MKNIVICADGTWNTPDQLDQGVPAPTNVAKLFNCVSDRTSDGGEQIKYYHPGVGTNGGWWERAIGGGTGNGLDMNIMSAYRKLSDTYEANDAIYLFGFSRGAYTVRSLCGALARCGLLDLRGLKESEAWSRVQTVFHKGYRRQTETRSHWEQRGWKFLNAPGSAIPIRFLGVWDTVGSLGVPDDFVLLQLIDGLKDYSFHDTKLSTSVATARHALAMDEMRSSFQPTIWTECAERDVRQLWFPGVHSDVGGGYREDGLANGALQWMLEEAAACGLAFESKMSSQVKPLATDVLHDSCTGIFRYLSTTPRSVPNIAETSRFHLSAIHRYETPPITQCPYRMTRSFELNKPTVVDVFANQPWNETGIWLEAGTDYEFKATGEWLDAKIKCGPEGTKDGKFEPSEIFHIAGSLVGKIETLLNNFIKRPEIDFRFTKRHENLPWFSLIGAIASGTGVDESQKPIPHETFLIGKGTRFRPETSGYFYAYSNDAYNCYGNNRGKVTLTLSRAVSA